MSAKMPDGIQEAITDFLAQSPTAQEILDYKFPSHLDDYLQELMNKNSTSAISPEELVELEDFLRFEHFITLLQLKVRVKLTETIQS